MRLAAPPCSAFAIANDSRKLPPPSAVLTIIPAVAGPWETSPHSSSVKSLLAVIRPPILDVACPTPTG